MENPQDYYKGDAPMSAAGARAAELRALPKDLAKQCEVVQGVLIHRDIAPWLYDLKLTEEQRDDGHVRPLAQMLNRIHALDDRPLTIARDPAHRMPTVCRHFSLMLSAILREQGIPARARCGFGAYFNPGKFEDHWVCEYWNAAQARWILVDAQMDPIQRNTFKLAFDPLDVPRDAFILAGDAWQMCRAGRADAKNFGLTHIREARLWFIAGNVVRDFASLNRMEALPWDVWGLMEMGDDALTEEKKALLDRVAALTLAGDEAFPEIRKLYESDDRLRMPPVVFNALRNAPESIAS
jgi:Transglutaminase-like superfamily